MAKKRKPTEVDEIKRRFREAVDPDWLDQMYAYKLGMNGRIKEAVEVMKSGYGLWGGREEIPDYEPILPTVEGIGTMNHALVSSRINIQAIVYADPVFEFMTRWPIVRKVNEAWVRYKWEEQNWANKNYLVGMEVEACGVGYIEHGINDEMSSDYEFRSVHDILPDPHQTSPQDARYYFRRARVPIDEAIEKYASVRTATGTVGKERVQALKGRMQARGTRNLIDSHLRATDVEIEFVYEWLYVDRHTLCLFLGSVTGDGEVFYLDPKNWEVKHGNSGKTPYSKMPFSVWVDSFTPGSVHPSSKMETTWKLTAQLNEIEEAMRITIRRSVPLNLISTFGLTPESLRKLQKVQDGEDFLQSINDVVLLNVQDVKKTIHREAGGEVTQTTIFLHGLLKNEINAATGVMDSQRGQPLPGEKTAFEVRELFASQGVQSRHTQRQYASFIKDGIKKQRIIAARFESFPKQLYLEDEGIFSFEVFSREEFLSQDIQLRISDDALTYKSRDQKIAERIEIFKAVDMVFLEMGIFDPVKIAKDINRVLGRTNPTEFFVDALLQATTTAQAGPTETAPGTQSQDGQDALVAAIGQALSAQQGAGGATGSASAAPARPVPAAGEIDFAPALEALAAETGVA